MDTNFLDADYADYAGKFAVEKGAIWGERIVTTDLHGLTRIFWILTKIEKGVKWGGEIKLWFWVVYVFNVKHGKVKIYLRFVS
jgi:hypothetical protein